MSTHQLMRVDPSTYERLWLTHHVRHRLRKRNILPEWADIVARYGTWNLSYKCKLDGDEEILQPGGCQLVKEQLGIKVDEEELMMLLRRELVAVVSPTGTHLITVYFKKD